MRPVNPANSGEEVWKDTFRRMRVVERVGSQAIMLASTSPVQSDGSDGDLWLDYNNGILWGPKGWLTPGVWPATYHSLSSNKTWIPLPLASGWSNYGGGFMPAQYRRFGDVVEMRGLIRAVPAKTLNVHVATLPFGPSSTELLMAWGGVPASGEVAQRLDMRSNGQLWLIDGNATNASTYMSLSGLRFSIA